MTVGSRVRVVNHNSAFYEHFGVVAGLTPEGLLEVLLESDFGGPLCTTTLHPQSVELSLRLPIWWQQPGWHLPSAGDFYEHRND